MNAIIGDNGIITRAQEANIQSSIASLEEYLQLKYTENYDENVSSDSKVEFLRNKYPGYFFGTALGYMPASDETGSYSLYLINKSELPEEIREGLVGGDAGEGSYTDYAMLNDVYGVTSNLKVYYCRSGLNSIKGVQTGNLDIEDMDKIVYKAEDAMSSFLQSYDTDGDGEISIKESRTIKSLTVDDTNMVNDFSNFYNLINLQELKLKNVTVDNLNGIENCTRLNYIYIENCKIANYSAIGKIGNRLNYLYLYNVTDSEVQKMCSKDANGIGNYDLGNLQYFGIVGNNRFITESSDAFEGLYQGDEYKSKSENIITTLSPLENLSKVTKEAVCYLFLQNNNITGDLQSIGGFENIRSLRVENNDLTSLDGIENMEKLMQIYAYYNSKIINLPDFGENNNLNVLAMQYCGLKNLNGLENCNKLMKLYLANNNINDINALSSKTKLSFLSLLSNKDLSDISALEALNDLIETNGENYIALNELYLKGCSSSMSAGGILKLIAKCGTKYSLPDGVKVLTGTVYDVAQYFDPLTVTYEQLHSDLYNNTYISKLSLMNVKQLDNDQFNEILSSLKNLVYLTLRGCDNLTTIDFIGEGKVTKLKQLILLGTKVKDLSNLDKYNIDLRDLRLDYAEVELTNIQNTISKLAFVNSNWDGWDGLSYGCYLVNDVLLSELSECDKITSLSFYLGLYEPKVVLDLKNCSSLRVANFRNLASTCYFPSNIKGIYTENCKPPVFEEDTFLDYYGYYELTSQDEFESFIEGAKNISSINQLEIVYFKNISSLNSLSNLLDTNINNFSFGNVDYIRSRPERYANNTFKNLGGLSYLTSLKNIVVTGSSLSDISGIKNLNSLESLVMPYNSISDGLKFLEGKTALKTIDLSFNAILNTSSYVEDGQTKTCDVVNIFADLRYRGSLTRLKLNGNSIDNWAGLETLPGWNSETKTGF